MIRKIREFRNTKSLFMAKSFCLRSFSPNKRLLQTLDEVEVG